jgi:hypothetical protein
VHHSLKLRWGSHSSSSNTLCSSKYKDQTHTQVCICFYTFDLRINMIVRGAGVPSGKPGSLTLNCRALHSLHYECTPICQFKLTGSWFQTHWKPSYEYETSSPRRHFAGVTAVKGGQTEAVRRRDRHRVTATVTISPTRRWHSPGGLVAGEASSEPSVQVGPYASTIR